MTRSPGFYGLIQYCQSLDRSECVNVGVYLICQARDAARVRVSETNDRIRKFFGANSFDDRRVTADKLAIKNRLERLGPVGITDIEKFVAQEAGHLVVTKPRPIAVVDLDADANELFDEFVRESPVRKRGARTKAPDISNIFDPLLLGAPIQKDLKVDVPTLNQKLSIPYGYLNDSMNYIKPHGFSSREQSAVQSASHLGVQGLMLNNHPIDIDGDKIGRKLIIVASFDGRSAHVKDRVMELLCEFPVRVVPMNDVQSFAQEVKAHARYIPPPAAE